MKITIFTPAYNRKKTLVRLYESLVAQTNKSFEWLIVDDGSTDGTEQYISELIKKRDLIIRYYKQNNSGKHIAHNVGVEMTNTELFTCVDSDDYLKETAVETILSTWNIIKENNDIVGMLAFRAKQNGDPITVFKSNEQMIKLKDAYKNGLSGDTMLIFRSDILKKYKFPNIENERFMPEAYLYDLIDKEGKLFLIREGIYICEYLEDGYTMNMRRVIASNPKGMQLFLAQRLKIDTSLKDKILDSIRYIAISRVIHKNGIVRQSVYPWISVMIYPLGIYMYNVRYKNLRNEAHK